MNIIVNGEQKKYNSNLTVSKLLALHQLNPELIVIELNEEILEKDSYDNIILSDGDQIEIIRFMGGG